VNVGHVEGFVVEDGEHITHVLLERGHMWGARELTIPVGAVDEVGSETIALCLTNEEVGRLAPVPVRRR
jgi:hypothetical protein